MRTDASVMLCISTKHRVDLVPVLLIRGGESCRSDYLSLLGIGRGEGGTPGRLGRKMELSSCAQVTKLKTRICKVHKNDWTERTELTGQGESQRAIATRTQGSTKDKD